MLHALVSQWHHGHICWQLASSYLHHRYPGMPATWYARYLHFVENRNYSPRNW